MTFSIKNDGYAFLIMLDLMFSVIKERVPNVASLKRLIYETFNSANLV